MECYKITSQPKYCKNLFNIHTINLTDNPINLKHITANPITSKHNVVGTIAVKQT
jgi:hypothetical protein